MSKRIVNKTLSAAIIAALYASASYAQQPATNSTTELDSVVVTGSYIKGTPEDSALPVDVVTAEDLAEQGAPSMVQMVKTITASQASIGESNRYNGAAGTASINLRGFGAARTLTLFNGHRLADSPIAAFQGGGANLNFIPQAAIGRVEILKDGAAATYGSDAIGGVVNFITRTDLDGLEVSGEYSDIAGSDGDYQADLVWGSKLDGGNILVAFGYRHRSSLDVRRRSWAIQPFENAAYGGWTGAGNPGNYVVNNTSSTATNVFRDNGCAELGGVVTGTGAASVCRFQFSNFNDLVNDEDHYQFHAEVNSTLGDSVKSHTEFTWGRDWVPNQRVSPANLTAQFPTPQTLGGTSGSLQAAPGINNSVRYNVPSYNPGFQDLITTCPTATPFFYGAFNCATLTAAGAAGGTGVDISPTVWRAIAHAGHPTNADKADHESIENKAFRISTGLKGDLLSAEWDVTATYMSAKGISSRNDLLVNRIQNGLNGYLSDPTSADACTSADIASLIGLGAARTAANHAALGCHFFNPFTNSVAVSAVNGAANPFYRGNVNPLVNNNPNVIETLYGNYTNTNTNELFVLDGVLSGSTGFELPGGEIGWALGTQYRYTRDKNEYGDLFNNRFTPCVDSIDDGTPVCGTPNGPLIFYGSNNNNDTTRGVYAGFGELSLPLFDSLNVSLAARYEKYPGKIGSTFDPKILVRYQVLDWLAFRGSAGTTFRAPVANTVTPGCNTGVANINGSYRAVETCGNEDLKPETAEAFNFGILFSPGNFTATFDYFRFKFEDELTAESASRMFATLFPTGGGATGRCFVPGGDTTYQPLEARFTFQGPCNSGNISRIRTFTVNGPGTDTSGIDARLEYNFPQLVGGSLTIGAEATYLIEFKRGAFALKDAAGVTFSDPEDRAGRHDLTSQFFSYPKIKGNLFFSYRINDLTFRLQSRYSEGTQAAFGAGDNGEIGDYYQHDVIARWNGPMDLTIGASVQNILDTDPPDAASMYNYDYTSGNPLGRVYELSFRKKF